MSKTPRPLLGAAALAAAALIWSSFAILVRMSGFNLPVFYAGWTRNIVAAILILVPLFIFKQFKTIERGDWKWFLGRSLGGLWGFIGSFYGFYYLPVGTAYFMHFGSATLASFVLGKLLFNEKLSRIKIVSLVLAALGVILIYGISINPDQAGWIWLLLSGGIGSSIWSIFPKKISTEYSPWQINGMDFLIFSVFAMLVSLWNHDVWSLPTASGPWLASLLFLVMGITTGQLVITGFKNLDAQRGSLIMLVEIAFGLILGALVFHEQLSILAWLGGALIIGAAALPEFVELHKKRRARVASLV